ncbi:deoxyribodipyrimidine photo-lyase, partial [Candidatus Kaiserbacteria bacterium]|nr:deoxyribodipyrimidine photo-lyase [Candidatus Kaiserbacteria bacterium]
MLVDQSRTRLLNEVEAGSGPVVYWMQRDQRSVDNWALLYAKEQADARQVALHVVFDLVESYGKASFRQFAFMLRGLCEVEHDLLSKNIQFTL